MITPIIKAEATKRINEFLRKGLTEEESIEMALYKIKELRKVEPLVVIHWEIEKVLIVKLSDIRSKTKTNI